MYFDVKLPKMYKNEDEALGRAIFITSPTPFNVLVTFSLWGWVNDRDLNFVNLILGLKILGNVPSA